MVKLRSLLSNAFRIHIDYKLTVLQADIRENRKTRKVGEQSWIRQNQKATGTRVLRYVICIILCFLSIIPFYILLINSTLKSSDILTGIKLVPGSQFITNFKGLLEGGAKTSGVNVLQAMLNSLIITVPATALQIYFGSLTAYAVTVYNFKAKNFAWGFIYAIMMIPQQVSIVGFIKICNLTHIYGSYLAMIIPAIASTNNCLLYEAVHGDWPLSRDRRGRQN